MRLVAPQPWGGLARSSSPTTARPYSYIPDHLATHLLISPLISSHISSYIPISPHIFAYLLIYPHTSSYPLISPIISKYILIRPHISSHLLIYPHIHLTLLENDHWSWQNNKEGSTPHPTIFLCENLRNATSRKLHYQSPKLNSENTFNTNYGW